jgi:hypothetical protein
MSSDMEGKMQTQIEGALLDEIQTLQDIQIENGMMLLRDIMLNEEYKKGCYASAWHDNIAMACYDAMCRDNVCNSRVSKNNKRKIANEAATEFMKLCFGVDTKLALNMTT